MFLNRSLSFLGLIPSRFVIASKLFQMFCRPTDPGSGSGSKRPRPDSPPLFSDDEETPVSQRARVASEDGGDGDDFMAGFGDKFADLESDAVERGGALVYAFVIGEAAIEQVDAQWRNEALERKARFERIEKKGQVLVPGPPSDTVTAIPDETTDNTGQLRAEHGHNQNSVILDEDAALALQLQMEWNQEHAGGAVQRADANNETAKTALALAVAEEKRREEFRRMRLAQEEDDARFARELQLQEESHYRQVARAQVAQHQPQPAPQPPYQLLHPLLPSKYPPTTITPPNKTPTPLAPTKLYKPLSNLYPVPAPPSPLPPSKPQSGGTRQQAAMNP
ncbi:hypothetical protein BC830DRAFT_493956 [Chytriomyces sp. MP71]|nr:hypothetical protein BC830DRAFT_493956 [Chytriomyces sp. MP71]